MILKAGHAPDRNLLNQSRATDSEMGCPASSVAANTENHSAPASERELDHEGEGLGCHRDSNSIRVRRAWQALKHDVQPFAVLKDRWDMNTIFIETNLAHIGMSGVARAVREVVQRGCFDVRVIYASVIGRVVASTPTSFKASLQEHHIMMW